MQHAIRLRFLPILTHLTVAGRLLPAGQGHIEDTLLRGAASYTGNGALQENANCSDRRGAVRVIAGRGIAFGAALKYDADAVRRHYPRRTMPGPPVYHAGGFVRVSSEQHIR